MDRTILHVDANCFYASVECLHNPDIRNKPVAVVGDIEKRHGIILTANYIAKKYNVKTGEAIFEARQKCPNLVLVKANMGLYMKFSRLIKEILLRYSDMVESFGSDEAWLDVTNSRKLFGNGEEIAKSISNTVKQELGITVSIGVSFNKVFAKLGSDMKKPDGITVITKENFKEKIWSLPVSNLLYVGKRTSAKLLTRNIKTIGDLANTKPEYLQSWFGKQGLTLYSFANGFDDSPVCKYDTQNTVKSVSNSITASRDLTNNDDVKMIIFVLADSIARRLREQGLYGKTVSIYVKNNTLSGYSKQCTLDKYTNLERTLSQTAFSLFCESYNWYNPVRAIGIAVSDLSFEKGYAQFDIYGSEEKNETIEKLEKAQDDLKRRFGSFCVRRGILIKDSKLTGFDPKSTPTSFNLLIYGDLNGKHKI